MKIITFSALSNKEVVNCKDGRLAGYVVDLKLDTDTGDVLSLFVKQKESLFCFSKKNLLEIPFENIEKIGQDIILVDLPAICDLPDMQSKKEKKRGLFQSFH